MLQALLNGKLSSSQENMEDVLTSCVFGCFKYLDPNVGLGPFLREARGIEPMDRPFADLQIQSAAYEFWPYWCEKGYENCEPDVVLTVNGVKGEKLMILVEVKYRSGKSAYPNHESEAPTDQLAKEWDHLVKKAEASGFKPNLVYVTSDAVIPRHDIDQATNEYETKRKEASQRHPFRCYWISWRSLYRVLVGSQGVLAADLRALAEKLEFKEFDGFSKLRTVSGIEWRYCTTYKWAVSEAKPIDWGYEQ